jgi:hypothetical protein
MRYTTTYPVALDPGDPLLAYFATTAAMERDMQGYTKMYASLSAQASHVRVAAPVSPAADDSKE